MIIYKYIQTSPYHLLCGDAGQLNDFDSGFQTRPIVFPPFEEETKNAWEDQEINLEDQRRVIKPMPPISHITISHPEWVKEAPCYQEEKVKYTPSQDQIHCLCFLIYSFCYRL